MSVILLVVMAMCAACAATKPAVTSLPLNAKYDLGLYSNVVREPFGEDSTLNGAIIIPKAGVTTTTKLEDREPGQAAAISAPAVQKMPKELGKAKLRKPPVPASVPEKAVTRVSTTTVTTEEKPEFGPAVGGNGPGVGKIYGAALINTAGNVGSAAVGGFFFKEGMRALRPDNTTFSSTQSGAGSGPVTNTNDNTNNNTNNNTTNIDKGHGKGHHGHDKGHGHNGGCK